MKLSMKEKKILYAFACPSHHKHGDTAEMADDPDR